MADVSELFDANLWRSVDGFTALTDITYHLDTTGRIARIAFDRPEVRNAFRPHTVDELYRALDDARQNPRVGVVLLTGNGPSAKDGGWAFCSGGDQRVRGKYGYEHDEGQAAGGGAGGGGLGRIITAWFNLASTPQVVAGAVLVAVFALLVEGLFEVGLRLAPRRGRGPGAV